MMVMILHDLMAFDTLLFERLDRWRMAQPGGVFVGYTLSREMQCTVVNTGYVLMNIRSVTVILSVLPPRSTLTFHEVTLPQQSD